MDNYTYFIETVEGLPSRNPAEDIQWLEEKLQPRVSPEGWLDLGDGVRLSLKGAEVTIENPDLPVRRTGTARTTVIEGHKNDKPYRRGLAGNGFETMAIHSGGGHGFGGSCAELQYHLRQYFKNNPPRHERERRRAAEFSELKSKLEVAEKKATRLESKLEAAEKKTVKAADLQNRVSVLEKKIREAADQIWQTRSFVKSRRFAKIRQMLESV